MKVIVPVGSKWARREIAENGWIGREIPPIASKEPKKAIHFGYSLIETLNRISLDKKTVIHCIALNKLTRRQVPTESCYVNEIDRLTTDSLQELYPQTKLWLEWFRIRLKDKVKEVQRWENFDRVVLDQNFSSHHIQILTAFQVARRPRLCPSLTIRRITRMLGINMTSGEGSTKKVAKILKLFRESKSTGVVCLKIKRKWN